MSAPSGAKRWLAKEMIAGAKNARQYDGSEDSVFRSAHIVGWLMGHLTDAEAAEVRDLLYGPEVLARAAPITSVDDPRVNGEA